MRLRSSSSGRKPRGELDVARHPHKLAPAIVRGFFMGKWHLVICPPTAIRGPPATTMAKTVNARHVPTSTEAPSPLRSYRSSVSLAAAKCQNRHGMIWLSFFRREPYVSFLSILSFFFFGEETTRGPFEPKTHADFPKCPNVGIPRPGMRPVTRQPLRSP
jgi:hypothetical protein